MAPLVTIGIASIGEMGAGIAKLLSAHNYRVVSNMKDRSEATRVRAQSALIQLVESNQELVEQSDYVLSIVPPRNAVETAQRFIAAVSGLRSTSKGTLHYVDLNAISPSTATKIADSFSSTPIRFVDGGIIGSAPKLQSNGTWTRPSLVVSGPHQIDEGLAKVLNVKHIADTIGPASGLKMCFASMTKGLTAIATQSFTTAHRLGVLDQLQSHLEEYNPKTGALAAKGLVSMPPKAYRWIDEMGEIGKTFEIEGGFKQDLFSRVGGVFKLVANDTELGSETTEDRKLGTTPEDVARCVSEGIERAKKKLD